MNYNFYMVDKLGGEEKSIDDFKMLIKMKLGSAIDLQS